MKRLLFVLAAMLFYATSAYAARVVDHGFEAAEAGEFALVGGMSYETGIVHSGSRSLRMHYLGNHVQGGTFNDFTFAKIPNEVFYRFWVYMPSSFQTDVISSTKGPRLGQSVGYPGYWTGWIGGSKALAVNAEGIRDVVNGGYTTKNYFGGPSIPQNQWVCVEGQLKNSTPGVADGIIRMWINGAQTINVTTVPSRGTVATPICPNCNLNFPDEGFNILRLYVQYGGPGDLYYDDMVVDNAVRIGCTGTGPPPPPVDTQPPTPPTNFTVN